MFQATSAGQAFDGKQLHFIRALQRFSVDGVYMCYVISTVHPGGCQQRDLGVCRIPNQLWFVNLSISTCTLICRLVKEPK